MKKHLIAALVTVLLVFTAVPIICGQNQDQQPCKEWYYDVEKPKSDLNNRLWVNFTQRRVGPFSSESECKQSIENAKILSQGIIFKRDCWCQEHLETD